MTICNHPDCESYSRDDCRWHSKPLPAVSDPDETILSMVQRQSVTLADLYRRGRAKGLIAARSDYH
jgi:hypothetical protein